MLKLPFGVIMLQTRVRVFLIIGSKTTHTLMCSKLNMLTTVEANAAIDAGDGIAADLALVNVSVDLALLEHVAASVA